VGKDFSQNDLRSRHRTWETQADDVAGLHVTGELVLFGIHLTSGSDAASMSVYNAITATGTPIVLKVASGGAGEFSFEPTGIPFDTGLFIATTGTSPTYVVRFMAV